MKFFSSFIQFSIIILMSTQMTLAVEDLLLPEGPAPAPLKSNKGHHVLMRNSIYNKVINSGTEKVKEIGRNAGNRIERGINHIGFEKSYSGKASPMFPSNPTKFDNAIHKTYDKVNKGYHTLKNYRLEHLGAEAARKFENSSKFVSQHSRNSNLKAM